MGRLSGSTFSIACENLTLFQCVKTRRGSARKGIFLYSKFAADHAASKATRKFASAEKVRVISKHFRIKDKQIRFTDFCDFSSVRKAKSLCRHKYHFTNRILRRHHMAFKRALTQKRGNAPKNRRCDALPKLRFAFAV